MSTETEHEAPRRRLSAASRREVIEVAATEVFSERGYGGASMGEIARRSGVTPPVLYDHFASKRDLYRRLLERHFAELREIWRSHTGKDPPRQRLADSLDAWFAYIETHPFAGKMLFRENSGDPDVDAVHREVAAESSAAIMPLFAAEPGAANLVGALDAEGMEMAWVVLRGVLQGLAVWWVDHPDVARERVVATAMNSLWIGFERVSQGETWPSRAVP